MHWYDESAEAFYVQYVEFCNPAGNFTTSTGGHNQKTIGGTVYYGRDYDTIRQYCELGDIIWISADAGFATHTTDIIMVTYTNAFFGLGTVDNPNWYATYARLLFTNSLIRGSSFYGSVKKMAYSPWTIEQLWIDKTDSYAVFGYCSGSNRTGINEEATKQILYDANGGGGVVPDWIGIQTLFYTESVTYQAGYANQGGRVNINTQATAWKKWNSGTSTFVTASPGDIVDGTLYGDQWLGKQRVSKNIDWTVITLI